MVQTGISVLVVLVFIVLGFLCVRDTDSNGSAVLKLIRNIPSAATKDFKKKIGYMVIPSVIAFFLILSTSMLAILVFRGLSLFHIAVYLALSTMMVFFNLSLRRRLKQLRTEFMQSGILCAKCGGYLVYERVLSWQEPDDQRTIFEILGPDVHDDNSSEKIILKHCEQCDSSYYIPRSSRQPVH